MCDAAPGRRQPTADDVAFLRSLDGRVENLLARSALWRAEQQQVLPGVTSHFHLVVACPACVI